MWRQGSVEILEAAVVALAAWLLGEGAQHHQSLFASRIAVSIAAVQVVANDLTRNFPRLKTQYRSDHFERLAPGTGVGAPTCGCLANRG